MMTSATYDAAICEGQGCKGCEGEFCNLPREGRATAAEPLITASRGPHIVRNNCTQADFIGNMQTHNKYGWDESEDGSELLLWANSSKGTF